MKNPLRHIKYWRVRRMTADEWYAADCPPWRDEVVMRFVIVEPRRKK